MSMHIDNANGCCEAVQHSQNTASTKSQGDAAQEALQKWIYAMIVQGFKNLGNAQGDNEGKGGRDVSANGPVSMDELNALAASAMGGSEAAIAEGTEILEALFGDQLAADKSVYFDEGPNDKDLEPFFIVSLRNI